ncbi:MAG: T9SS type A sorting domain-containing protein [Bacteroidales bacterium]|nr:T9SS type A sorting domain-containing protein [Bacteroidales bacterium]
MKKIFTLLLLLSVFIIYAQEPIPRQKVIVEVGTGTWCGACPAVVHIIDTFIEEGLNIAVIEYHNGDAYTNADGSIRENYYSFPWFPTTYYDSNHIGYDDWNLESVHRAYYEERQDSLASFGVNIVGEVDDLTVSGTMYAEKVAEYAGQNLVMHLVITETDIPENWAGETELDFVERKMFPDGHGTALSFADNSLQSIDFSFDIDAFWVKDNCELIYFIQDNDTKEILQGNSILLNDLSLNVGISSVEETNSYIYPNPVQDLMMIHTTAGITSITNIEVMDLMGKVVFKQETNLSEINIEELPRGIYLVSYLNNGVKKTEKIAKK